MRTAHAFFLGVGIASIVGAASGAAVFLALISEPQVADRTAASETVATPARDPCENQAWPHFDRRCLERTAGRAEQRAPRNVGTDNPIKPAEAREIAVAPVAPAAPPPSQALTTPVSTTPAQQTPPQQIPAQQTPPEPAPAHHAQTTTQAAVPETTGTDVPEPAPRPAAAPSPATSEPQAEPERTAETPPKRKERSVRKTRRAPKEKPPASHDDSALAAVEAELEAMAQRGELRSRKSRSRDRDESRRARGEDRGPIVRRWVETVPADGESRSADSRRVIILRRGSGITPVGDLDEFD